MTANYLGTGLVSMPLSTDVYLSAGDTVYASVYTSSGTGATLAGNNEQSSFSGHKVY